MAHITILIQKLLGSKQSVTSDQIQGFRRALAQTGVASSDFDLNKDTDLPPGRVLRPAGVLAPLIERNGQLELILTKRSSRLKHHPGQIAFPGGKQDDTDADVIAAALREAEEEIGPFRVVGEYAEVEHVGVGQDDVGVASCPQAVLSGGVSVVCGGHQPGNPQATQAAQLVLGESLGGKDQE